MTGPVKISVVMSVYNGAATLAATMDSIQHQTERDFEFVIVDDGSTDATPSILADRAASDPRIRLITQTNSGLTAALIVGCGAARGDFIARQDCGDRSDLTRLERQGKLAEAGHVLVSCATQFVGPAGEPLYVSRGAVRTRESLLHDPVERITGLVHGTAFFRRDAYVSAGGYRSEFRYAQDLDLWIRLAQIGSIAFADDVLYEATWDPDGISGRGPALQIATARLAIALRDSPEAQELLLSQVRDLTQRPRPSQRGSKAPAYYFIASCLLASGDERWRSYARRAVRENPLHLRAWLKLLLHR